MTFAYDASAREVLEAGRGQLDITAEPVSITYSITPTVDGKPITISEADTGEIECAQITATVNLDEGTAIHANYPKHPSASIRRIDAVGSLAASIAAAIEASVPGPSDLPIVKIEAEIQDKR